MSCPPQTLLDSCCGGSVHSGWMRTLSGPSWGLGPRGLEVDTEVGPTRGETGDQKHLLVTCSVRSDLRRGGPARRWMEAGVPRAGEPSDRPRHAPVT